VTEPDAKTVRSARRKGESQRESGCWQSALGNPRSMWKRKVDTGPRKSDNTKGESLLDYNGTGTAQEDGGVDKNVTRCQSRSQRTAPANWISRQGRPVDHWRTEVMKPRAAVPTSTKNRGAERSNLTLTVQTWDADKLGSSSENASSLCWGPKAGKFCPDARR